MKIICKINDSPWVSFGEAYYPLALSFSLKRGIDVYIQSGNDNQPIWQSLSSFEVVDQTIPSSWVRKVDSDPEYGIVTYLPSSWTKYEGFFDDFCDDVPAAIELFNAEAIKIYNELNAPGYVIGLKREDFEKVLNGDVKLINRLNVNENCLIGDEVPVNPCNIRHMLLEFLNDNISADDLYLWANFILRRDEYISPGGLFNDVLVEHYENMWYVIEHLASPQFDGDMTKERVTGYLQELEQYKGE